MSTAEPVRAAVTPAPECVVADAVPDENVDVPCVISTFADMFSPFANVVVSLSVPVSW